MKSIVFFINSMSSGGAEHQLCELANGLVEKGYDVIITTFSDIPDHYLLDKAVKRHRLAPGKSKYAKLWAIWKYFIKSDADCVVGFGQKESILCVTPLLFRSRHKIRAIAGERNTNVGKVKMIDRLVRNLVYSRSDYIVPNSFSQQNHLTKVFPKYAKKIRTITNYTDIDVFCAKPLPENNVIKIGVFSRYSVQKNCVRFVEAIDKARKLTDRQFVIWWYGDVKIKDNENPFYLEMKEKVEKYGLQRVIILNGHVKNVQELMGDFDAICLPSLWEGFSNSISEALSCGKPLLVSNVADNSVMVQNGKNGYLFNPYDVNSIAGSFVDFLKLTRKERQQMGMWSRQRAEELFDYNRFIDSYIKLFESK